MSNIALSRMRRRGIVSVDTESPTLLVRPRRYIGDLSISDTYRVETTNVCTLICGRRQVVVAIIWLKDVCYEVCW